MYGELAEAMTEGMKNAMKDGQAGRMEVVEFQAKAEKEIKEKQLVMEREKAALEREKFDLERAEKEEDRASRKRQREWEEEDRKGKRAGEMYTAMSKILATYKEFDQDITMGEAMEKAKEQFGLE